LKEGSEVVEVVWDDMILIGFVSRTHGNKGQVILKSESDFADQRFRPGARVYARVGAGPIEALEITAARFQQGRPIVGFEGFGTISDAERLAGAELRIPESDQAPLPDGAYYHHQLIGCAVVTASGEAIGRVSAVQGDGEATRLVVKGPRAEVLIPLAEEICAVDIAAKRIVVTPPEGLLEVNGEWRG
jgi:16S rRNA processing protein RimM